MSELIRIVVWAGLNFLESLFDWKNVNVSEYKQIYEPLVTICLLHVFASSQGAFFSELGPIMHVLWGGFPEVQVFLQHTLWKSENDALFPALSAMYPYISNNVNPDLRGQLE